MSLPPMSSPVPRPPHPPSAPGSWTGDPLDGDVLAAIAFLLFPLLCFYGRRHFHSGVTLCSMLVVAYISYVLLGYVAHVSPGMEWILVGVSALATFTAVIAAADLGVFIVGAAAGALMGNLVLHFVSIPETLIPDELWFRLLCVVIPAVAVGALTLSLTTYSIRIVSSFVGAYLLVASLSRLLLRLGLSVSAPFDPHVFFGPLSLLSMNPAPAFNSSLLLSYTLVTLWLVVSLVGVLVQYHQQYEYKEIERIRVNGHEYRRVVSDGESIDGAGSKLSVGRSSYHGARDGMEQL